jgi:hypothetical protein
LNNQSIEAAGSEANLDSQFAFGLTYPTQQVAWTTAGSPPFQPDEQTPKNTNGTLCVPPVGESPMLNQLQSLTRM